MLAGRALPGLLGLLALACAGLACYPSREVPGLTIAPTGLPPAQAGQPYQVTNNVGEPDCGSVVMIPAGTGKAPNEATP